MYYKNNDKFNSNRESFYLIDCTKKLYKVFNNKIIVYLI